MGITAAVARKYPLPSHVMFWKSVWNATAICGNTTLTMVLSRIAISRPSAITIVACHLYERCMAQFLSVLRIRLREIDHHPVDGKRDNILPRACQRRGRG